MTDPNPMLAKIRALLAKAESPAATPQEAEAYFAKAAELMAKYGVERAMLADAVPGLDRPADRVITVTGTYVVDRIDLLHAILRPLGLQGVRLRDRRGNLAPEVHVFGYEADIERAELLFTSLLLQAFNGTKHGRPVYGESLKAYRKTWLMGFSRSVERRLAEIEARARGEADATSDGRSAELVIAERHALTLARYEAAYPASATEKRMRTVSGTGLHAGELAGNRADLGQTRLTPQRRAINS